MTWRLHWLEASGDLDPWRSTIAEEVEIARKAIAGVLPVSPLDILVQRLPGAVIPETGTTGLAMRPGLFSLTIDPTTPTSHARCVMGTCAGLWRTRPTTACAWLDPATAGRWVRPW